MEGAGEQSITTYVLVYFHVWSWFSEFMFCEELVLHPWGVHYTSGAWFRSVIYVEQFSGVRLPTCAGCARFSIFWSISVCLFPSHVGCA